MSELLISDRMKQNYEGSSQSHFTRRMPLIIRVDGKAFHTYTADLPRPFSRLFREAMTAAAFYTSREMQGFKLGYVRSDEVSFLLTDYDTLQTQAWFGGNLQKIVSISAALMTLNFDREELFQDRPEKQPVFDARAFIIPREEVTNYFLSRSLDWQRNSLSMYARSFFSHRQLYRKTRTEVHEMLHNIGKNWATDLYASEKNGVFIHRNGNYFAEIPPSYKMLDRLIKPLIDIEETESGDD